MTPAETTLVIILICLLSVFLLLCIISMVLVVQLLLGVKRAVSKAEATIDTVESAASEVLRDTQGRLAFFKLIRNIIKLTQHKGKK